MARLITVTAIAATLATACALYGLKYDSRLIEDHVRAQERRLDKVESDIAMLKAERAYLGRPERIEQLARGIGLGPVREAQLETIAPTPTLADKSRPDDPALAPSPPEPGRR